MVDDSIDIFCLHKPIYVLNHQFCLIPCQAQMFLYSASPHLFLFLLLAHLSTLISCPLVNICPFGVFTTKHNSYLASGDSQLYCVPQYVDLPKPFGHHLRSHSRFFAQVRTCVRSGPSVQQLEHKAGIAVCCPGL